MKPPVSRAGNFNSVLITIVLAISAWTCKTVVDEQKAAATVAQQVSGHDKEINAIQVDLADAQKDIINLKVRFARELGQFNKQAPQDDRN